MKREKEILFLCQFFYPEYVSSATLPYDTAVALSENGHTVDVLCGYPNEYTKQKNIPLKENINGISIKRLRYLQLKRSNFVGRMINYFSFTFKVFLNIFFFNSYKVVIVYSNPPILPYIAYLAKKIYKFKLVFIAYDLYPEIAVITNQISNTGIISKFMRHINEKLFPELDSIVALSSEMKKFIVDNRDVESSKICVIPNWYKDDKNNMRDMTADNCFYDEYHDKTVISYLGNMGICQDIDTLIDAAIKLKDHDKIRFLFAGHGNKVKYLKDIILSQNLKNVKFYDFLMEKEYKDALITSSFSVVSLTKGVSGMCVPSKTYGYMMAGIPIIAILDLKSDIAIDIRNNYAGLLCGNFDSQVIVDFLLKHSDGKYDNEVKYMSENIRKVFLDKYEKNICLKQYSKLFDNICERNVL